MTPPSPPTAIKIAGSFRQVGGMFRGGADVDGAGVAGELITISSEEPEAKV
jgi:hypothetical protein